jgi:hypothetical protein
VSRSLFHYQKLREDYLVTLLAERRVKLSQPDAFNDPWDCRVHFSVPRDRGERQRLVQWLTDENRKIFPSVARHQRRRRAHELKAKPTHELETIFLEWEQRMYRVLCELHRVYCLSERCDSSLMWSHYTNKHQGICLEFDALAAPFTHAAKVIYRATYPAFDVTAPGTEPLLTKSDVWRYESEWRIISEERAGAQSPNTIKTDNGFLTLLPGVLKSIIIGCQASDDKRQLVANLVRDHTPDVLVRQATSTSDSYDLVITPPVGYENATNERGERLIWLDHSVVARLRAMRGPGESYSDVILRLVEADTCAR